MTAAPLRRSPLLAAPARLLALLALLLGLAGCAVPQLVEPYDQGVVDEVSELHVAAGALLIELEEAGTAAAYPDYAARWAEVLARADAAFARAAANSDGLSEFGQGAADVINRALAEGTGADSAAYEGLSLSEANLFDLRLLILRWRDSHKEAPRAGAIWSARRSQLASAISAILVYEAARAPAAPPS